MLTKEALVAAALKALEQGGEAQFSTRAVCAIANVTAPTLYHHFGTADGLLSAALAEAFAQFLASKRSAIQSSDPEMALRQGWDNYVQFAAARPRLYEAMMGRVLHGGNIAAAEEGFAHLKGQVAAIAAEGRLAVTPEAAADLMWASANAAALLYLTIAVRRTSPPDPAAVNGMRDATLAVILIPRSKAKSR